MAYPMPVTEEPLITPHGHATNIRTIVTPPAVEAWDYFPDVSRVDSRLVIFNTISTPWWTTTGVPTPVDRHFSDAFSAAFQGGVGSPQNP